MASGSGQSAQRFMRLLLGAEPSSCSSSSREGPPSTLWLWTPSPRCTRPVYRVRLSVSNCCWTPVRRSGSFTHTVWWSFWIKGTWPHYDPVRQVDARNIDGSTPLCDACAAGSLDCVKLLLEYGATVNPPLFTFSPLHEACMGGTSYCKQQITPTGSPALFWNYTGFVIACIKLLCDMGINL